MSTTSRLCPTPVYDWTNYKFLTQTGYNGMHCGVFIAGDWLTLYLTGP